MNFEKLTQQQIKGILLKMKQKGDDSKEMEMDAKSMVMDMKSRILSVISSGDD